MTDVMTQHLADDDETPQSTQLAILNELETQRNTLRRKLGEARREREDEHKVRKALDSDVSAIRGIAVKARIEASEAISGIRPIDDTLAKVERYLAQIEALAGLER